MEIRQERPEDGNAIEQVVRDAFLSATHTSGTEPLIVQELRRAGALSISLVAVVDGKIVGHVAVAPVAISDGSAGWYGLGPVAVVPSHRIEASGTRWCTRRSCS